MTIETLRLLWSLVLEISPDNVAELSDDVLVRSLFSQVNSRICLSLEEQTAVRSYLSARKPLICEMLQSQAI
ncbi:MAG: hypothetical protein MJA27_11405 [Pseudanabaenales cyanobacterium]|nr:hypothetical protein [Pseudanabaenales cyanobacterium]